MSSGCFLLPSSHLPPGAAPAEEELGPAAPHRPRGRVAPAGVLVAERGPWEEEGEGKGKSGEREERGNGLAQCWGAPIA